MVKIWVIPFYIFGTFIPFPAMILWVVILYLMNMKLIDGDTNSFWLLILPSFLIWLSCVAIVQSGIGED